MTKAQLILGTEGNTGHLFATTPYLSSGILLLLCTYYFIFPQTSPPAFSPVSKKKILHFPFVKLTLGQFILIAEMLSVCGQPSRPWKICRCWRYEERVLSQCSWFSTTNSSPEVWGDAALASSVSKLFIYKKLFLFHLNSEVFKTCKNPETAWSRDHLVAKNLGFVFYSAQLPGEIFCRFHMSEMCHLRCNSLVLISAELRWFHVWILSHVQERW